MNKATNGIGTDHADEPQNNKYDSDGVEHDVLQFLKVVDEFKKVQIRATASLKFELLTGNDPS